MISLVIRRRVKKSRLTITERIKSRFRSRGKENCSWSWRCSPFSDGKAFDSVGVHKAATVEKTLFQSIIDLSLRPAFTFFWLPESSPASCGDCGSISVRICFKRPSSTKRVSPSVISIRGITYILYEGSLLEVRIVTPLQIAHIIETYCAYQRLPYCEGLVRSLPMISHQYC